MFLRITDCVLTMQGDDEDEDRPKYGYGQEEGYGRKKYVSFLSCIFYAIASHRMR